MGGAKRLPRVGVFVCHCGLNIAGVINVEKVVEEAFKMPDVVIAEHYVYMCSEPGQKLIEDAIKKYDLTAVVVAACTPSMHEETFRRVLERSGLSPYVLEFVNLREHCSWVHAHEPEKATEKAIALVRMGVAKARFLKPLEKRRFKVWREALVIGGGISGITASLNLANAGFRVYLVEKSPTIGGHMLMLDKTFPTLDCSACILTPRMVEVSKHPNIELMAYSEVTNVQRVEGGFKVEVLKKPRYVIEDKCTGCGICSQHCPIEVSNEYDANLGSRKAIYIPFPQSIPLKYVIDVDHCIRCGACERVCQAKAIDFEQKPTKIELEVGTIIVSVGFKVFDAKRIIEYGYGSLPDVTTTLELERLLSASGPTCGRVMRLSNGKIPRSIAFIQCVGSRDKRFNEYCCRIGCMVALKQALLLKERLGEETEVYICFNDMRAFGKGYEEFYNRVRDSDIKFVRGIPSEVKAESNGKLSLTVYDQSTERFLELKVDMVVLTVGIEPSDGIESVRNVLPISIGFDGFLSESHPKLKPVETNMRGVFIAGACQGPKDIVDTVSQASAAAMKAAELLSRGEIEVEPTIAVVNEFKCRGCGRCEEVCEYGAIRVEEINGRLVAKVNEALCEGCGACSVKCPTGAVKVQRFKSEQIMSVVSAATYEIG